MTLITGYSDARNATLIGDLLVSDVEKSDKEFVFPTVGKVTKRQIVNGDYSPYMLKQKVSILSPKLAMACANSRMHQILFIDEILKAKVHDDPSVEKLRAIYDEIGGQEELSVIGIINNGSKTCVFDFDAVPVESPNTDFEFFKADGTGYWSLLNIVPNINMGKLTSGRMNIFQKRIADSLILTSSLLAQEVAIPESLKQLFGVGYETVHLIGNNLSKFNDVTYVFWITIEEKKGLWKTVPFPFLAFKYSYFKDILVIRSTDISWGEKIGRCKIETDKLHAISPAHRVVDPDEMIGYTPMSLNSNWMCNVFLGKNIEGAMGAFSEIGFYRTEKPPIIWENEFRENEGMYINKKFIDNSIRKLESGFNEDS